MTDEEYEKRCSNDPAFEHHYRQNRQEELDAAKQQIEHFEVRELQLLRRIVDLECAKEEVERKLVIAMEAIVAFENYTLESTTLTLEEGRKKWFEFVGLKNKALTEIKQPQKQP